MTLWSLRSYLRFFLLVALVAAVAVIDVGAEQQRQSPLPQPPCEAFVYPEYPTGTAALNIRFWNPGDLGADWQPPACTGWISADFAVLLATTGRFENSSGLDRLLEKVGSVSTLKGLRYWSVPRGRWTTLIDDAHALSGPAKGQRRGDFSPAELQVGKTLYYWQEESTTAGSVVYRLRVLERSAGRLAISLENASPGKVLGITMVPAGRSQSVYFFEQLDDDQWGYYCLARLGRGAHELLPISEASYANRASAVFRYFSGLGEDDLPVWYQEALPEHGPNQ